MCVDVPRSLLRSGNGNQQFLAKASCYFCSLYDMKSASSSYEPPMFVFSKPYLRLRFAARVINHRAMWRARLKGAALIGTLLCIIAFMCLLRSSTNVQEESILPVAGNVHSSSV